MFINYIYYNKQNNLDPGLSIPNQVKLQIIMSSSDSESTIVPVVGSDNRAQSVNPYKRANPDDSEVPRKRIRLDDSADQFNQGSTSMIDHSYGLPK